MNAPWLTVTVGKETHRGTAGARWLAPRHPTTQLKENELKSPRNPNHADTIMRHTAIVDGKSVQVTVFLNTIGLAKLVGDKAARNRTGRARMISGYIIAVTT